MAHRLAIGYDEFDWQEALGAYCDRMFALRPGQPRTASPLRGPP